MEIGGIIKYLDKTPSDWLELMRLNVFLSNLGI